MAENKDEKKKANNSLLPFPTYYFNKLPKSKLLECIITSKWLHPSRARYFPFL